ncbi:DUF397 domain-containing protein [Saccharothrix obliqua]|uniref:DUF397 domain-containing protein n=1 Tax=Saccharothrix obliqua TaxID=2861747 RepID=UPI001C5F9AF0|nr:DUF397 domain-containing protein [Saccharothrix obliqua]MBW4716144.1 DUF397 domain-containing protein [Saccharothrix obliqua]
MNAWRKSSHSSDQANCVEVRRTTGSIAVRDSKNPHGPVLNVTAVSWRRFLR